jgi:hypothetical protein
VTVFSELIFVEFRLSSHFILIEFGYKLLIICQNWRLLVQLLLLLVIIVTLSTTGDEDVVVEL